MDIACSVCGDIHSPTCFEDMLTRFEEEKKKREELSENWSALHRRAEEWKLATANAVARVQVLEDQMQVRREDLTKIEAWKKQREQALVDYKNSADIIIRDISKWFQEDQPDLLRRLEILTARIAFLEGGTHLADVKRALEGQQRLLEEIWDCMVSPRMRLPPDPEIVAGNSSSQRSGQP